LLPAALAAVVVGPEPPHWPNWAAVTPVLPWASCTWQKHG